MKKAKKHIFKYQDPEKTVEIKSKETKTKGKKAATQKAELVPSYVNRDLKRTVITIASFILIVIALYIIQNKTELVDPVLKIFKIER